MIMAVTSGKGGTGKSCVAAYTGVAFAKTGKRTVIVEMGATARSADLILGTSNDVLFDFSDIASGKIDIKKTVVKTSYEELFLISGPIVPMQVMLDLSWYVSFFKTLKEVFDVIILDGVDFRIFPTVLAETILLVVTPESLAIRAAAMHSRALYDAGATNIKLVINDVSAQVMPMYGARDFDDVIDIIGAQLIAVIPESPILKYSSNNAQKVDAGSLTIQIFDNLAQRLMGEHPPLLVK